MIKECKKHGMVEHIKRSDNNGYRCKACYHEYNKAQGKKVSQKRKEKMSELIQYKGGKCQACGYSKCEEALDFHHLNPKTKSFNISAKIFLSFEALKKEADKCILICCNCHREIHDGTLQLKEEKDKLTFYYPED